MCYVNIQKLGIFKYMNIITVHGLYRRNDISCSVFLMLHPILHILADTLSCVSIVSAYKSVIICSALQTPYTQQALSCYTSLEGDIF